MGYGFLLSGPREVPMNDNPRSWSFRLVAGAPGRLELRFVLKRRWEQEPIEIRVVEIEVR